jgi:hypothetical protein
VSRLDSNVSMVVAALDLELVRLLRGAIRAADLASGQGGAAGPFFGPAAVIEPRPRHHPDPVIEPRQRIRPAPRFEPRPVVHPTLRLEVELNEAARVAPPPDACPPCPHKSALPPPWKLAPWECPLPPRPLIKVNVRRTDIIHKGSLIDMFI